MDASGRTFCWGRGWRGQVDGQVQAATEADGIRRDLRACHGAGREDCISQALERNQNRLDEAARRRALLLPRRVPVQPATAVFAGASGSCASTQSGAVCWGMVGGSLLDPARPFRLLTSEAVGTMDLDYGTCYSTSLGLTCLGFPQLLAPSELNPSGTSLRRLEVGLHFACALSESGILGCSPPGGPPVRSVLAATSSQRVDDVAVGGIGVCVILRGHLSCTREDGCRSAVVVGSNLVRHVEAGGALGCAIDDEERVWCWRSAASSRCRQAVQATPVRLRSVVRDLAVGGGHACAVSRGGDLWCWGANDYGQLGQASRARYARPVRVHALAPSVTSLGTEQVGPEMQGTTEEATARTPVGRRAEVE
ncbi:MAG: hypothetical protein IT378_12290 [Sandaracinaceae bacterium]|nr:hypothetical protein [Sandaracinaceae bacterium]